MALTKRFNLHLHHSTSTLLLLHRICHLGRCDDGAGVNFASEWFGRVTAAEDLQVINKHTTLGKVSLCCTVPRFGTMQPARWNETGDVLWREERATSTAVTPVAPIVIHPVSFLIRHRKVEPNGGGRTRTSNQAQ